MAIYWAYFTTGWIFAASFGIPTILGGLSVLFSILACVLDTDKDIGGNWYCKFPTLPFARVHLPPFTRAALACLFPRWPMFVVATWALAPFPVIILSKVT